MGEVITGRELKKRYGKYASMVLGNILSPLPRRKREQPKYELTGELPTEEEYRGMEHQRFTIAVEDLIGDANTVIEELAEEMDSWYNNLPENLQNSSRGESIQEAYDTLSGIPQPEYGLGLEIGTVYFPFLGVSSRSDRASEAASYLHAASEALLNWIESKKEEAGDRELTDEEDGLHQEVQELAESCEDAANELENVCFPGMYD